MGYKGSPLYVQRKIDHILRPYQDYVRCYVDDIIIFFKIFENYIEYLNKIFQLFDNLDMILKRSKIYIAYLLIILLGQRVNDLNIIYSKERIAAISKFNQQR